MSKTEKFAVRVKTLRDERGLTQTQLAKAAGLSAAFLSRLMKGEREMTFEYVVAIASALKVTVGELVAGTTAQDITTKWVEYEKFDEAERGRLAALQELDVQRREIELLREGVAKLAAAEEAARELPLMRQSLAEAQATLRHCTADRDALRVKNLALTTALETCNTHRITLQRMLEGCRAAGSRRASGGIEREVWRCDRLRAGRARRRPRRRADVRQRQQRKEEAVRTSSQLHDDASA